MIPKHLTPIINDFEVVPKAIVEVVAAYILYLMLETKGHQARQAARLSGKHESCFSRMLSRPDNLIIAKGCLNRSVRRRLERRKDSEKGARPMILIDSTLVGRRGRKVENAGFYKLGKRTIRGHKIVNFVLVIGQDLIPLSAVAHYSKEYCEENGFTYRTENELIIDWLNWLHYSGLFPKEYIKHLHFVCDAGYDAWKVQKAFNRIGCHFTMCVKTAV
jgi:hypothetical protein